MIEFNLPEGWTFAQMKHKLDVEVAERRAEQQKKQYEKAAAELSTLRAICGHQHFKLTQQGATCEICGQQLEL